MASISNTGGKLFVDTLLNFVSGADIASAATVDLTAATGNTVTITGTTATSALTMNDGQHMTLVPSGAWPLTYNATTCNILGGADYTCTAGQPVEVFKTGGVVYVLPKTRDTSIKNGTMVSASGTAIDFTGLPPGVKKITVTCLGISTNGTNDYRLLLGNSGGFETSGYTSTRMIVNTTPAVTYSSSTAGFDIMNAPATTYILDSTIVLTLVDAATNLWSCSSQATRQTATYGALFHEGSKALSGELTQVRLTTVGGTDSFDAGSVNIQYEV